MAANLQKSTSDDSHLAGDSKQSENKHFAGMAAEVTEGTSDDTHLADDSKRQENAAGHSGYAPPVQEERRIASDGNAYTFREFLDHYGKEWGTSKWSAAQDTTPPAPAAAVNTLLTPRTAGSTQVQYLRIAESETRESFCHDLTCELGLRQRETAILAQCMTCWHEDGFELVNSSSLVYTTRTGQKVHLSKFCGNSKSAIPHRVCSRCLPTVMIVREELQKRGEACAHAFVAMRFERPDEAS